MSRTKKLDKVVEEVIRQMVEDIKAYEPQQRIQVLDKAIKLVMVQHKISESDMGSEFATPDPGDPRE